MGSQLLQETNRCLCILHCRLRITNFPRTLSEQPSDMVQLLNHELCHVFKLFDQEMLCIATCAVSLQRKFNQAIERCRDVCCEVINVRCQQMNLINSHKNYEQWSSNGAAL